MKKGLLIVFGIVAMATVSCKKNYGCSCTTTDSAPGSTSETVVINLNDVSKATAKRTCVSYQNSYTAGTSTYIRKTECELK